MMGPDCKMGDMGGFRLWPSKKDDQAQAGPARGAVSGAAIVNARCPIMGGKPVATLTRDYNGQTVGFCCGMCPGQWDRLTDAQKDAKLAKVAGAGI